MIPDVEINTSTHFATGGPGGGRGACREAWGGRTPGHITIVWHCLMLWNVTINASTHSPSIQTNRVWICNLQQNALIIVLLGGWGADYITIV